MEMGTKSGMLLCEPIFVPKGQKIRGSGGVLADARFCALQETGQVRKSGGKKSDRKKQPDDGPLGRISLICSNSMHSSDFNCSR